MLEFSRKISIEPCYQKEAKGLGHAILQAKDAVLEKNAQQFFTLLPDDIIDSKPSSCFKLKSYLDKYKASGAILVQDVPLEKTDCYGVIDAESLENNGEICKIKSLVEKPQPSNAPSTLAVVGRYILPCSIFDELEKTKPGKGGEIQLTDAINSICKKEKIISVKLSGQRLDTGTPLGYNLACLWYGLKDPDQKKALKEAFNQWT